MTIQHHDRDFRSLEGRTARHYGINLVGFTPKILSDPRLTCYLTYTYDYLKKSVVVERTPGEVVLEHIFHEKGPSM